MNRVKLSILVLASSVGVSASAAEPSRGPSFRDDVLPILSRACFACHGPDEEQRQAELRLDLPAATATRTLLRPGKPQKSELVRRIFSEDPEQHMPPADAETPLSDEQKQILRDWIASGAEYEQHWAFVPPRRPALPTIENPPAGWPANSIDNFVLAKLQHEGISPSPRADWGTLVRRLSLDLVGLPPSPAMMDHWLARLEQRPDAYDQLVDHLLTSPAYGERWARSWLDLARYADTNGYEKDRPRSIWPYRDWVIRAINSDMPFDQFSVEQLAGDMLPEASSSQRIATGFHRNTMLNEEGGIDPLEFRFYAMVDRVATTGTVWLGLTLGCTQCHSHKYDPLSHTEYYRFMALMNNADEPDLTVPDPSLLARQHDLQRQIKQLEGHLPSQFIPLPGTGPEEERRRISLESRFSDWLTTAQASATGWSVIRPEQLCSNLPKLEVLPDGSVFSSGDVTKRDLFELSFPLDESTTDGLPVTAIRLEVLPDPRLPAGGPGRAYYEGRKGDFFLSEFTAALNTNEINFSSASHSYGKIAIGSGNANAENVFDKEGSTGWSTAERPGEPHQLVLNLAEPIAPSGTLTITMLFERHFVASLGRFRIAVTGDKGPVRASTTPSHINSLLARPDLNWPPDQRAVLKKHFLLTCDELKQARKPIDALRAQLPDLPITLVMQERPADNPRITHRHHRGEYLSPREEVTPGIPAVLQPAKDNSQGPSDRLQTARWLASAENPLVARVTVNRAWQSIMGRGIVATSDDFGLQGTPPTHPDLLDWLAVEFIQQGWSLKQLHRRIVTSATYRQSSRIDMERFKRDPENQLLARASRFRVDAEVVRDILLEASGLASNQMLGPSVRPPQPAGATALAYGDNQWPVSTGSDRYRRSIYTFSKRTAPFAAYLTFDGPSGENCLARRDRSNTPLQALTLLNDEMFMEFALAAARAESSRPAVSTAERLTRLFRRFLTRPPSNTEIEALTRFHDAQLKRLENRELMAASISGKGTGNHLAALVLTARALMNFDETITRQ